MCGKRSADRDDAAASDKKKPKKKQQQQQQAESDVDSSADDKSSDSSDDGDESDTTTTTTSAAAAKKAKGKSAKPLSNAEKDAYNELGARLITPQRIFNLPQCYRCSTKKERNTCEKLADGVLLKYLMCGHACLGGAQEAIIIIERMEEAKSRGKLTFASSSFHVCA